MTSRSVRRSVHTRFTTTADGDLAVDGDPVLLEARRAAIAPTPWTWLRQVHGNEVVVVEHPGHHAGAEADAAVTDVVGATLAVNTADCAGVLMWGNGDDATGSSGDRQVTAVGAAHAGWRGLYDGVLQRAVAALRDLGAEHVEWQLGPCISPAAYEFGERELELLVDRYGPTVRSTTADGRPALDLRAGVRAAMAEVDAVDTTPGEVACTALDEEHFSWRARHDVGRQSAVVWMQSEPDESSASAGGARG